MPNHGQRHMKYYIHTTITSSWRLINSIQSMHKWRWQHSHYQTNILISLNHGYKISKKKPLTQIVDYTQKKEQEGHKEILGWHSTEPSLFCSFFRDPTPFPYPFFLKKKKLPKQYKTTGSLVPFPLLSPKLNKKKPKPFFSSLSPFFHANR